MLNLREQHEKCLYPEVRITAGGAMGSGTVIYCEPAPDKPGMWDTYVLTNEHVVDDLITVANKWNTILKREVKEDTLGHPTIEIFQYAYPSRIIGGTSFLADIMTYDKDEDLALLRTRSPTEFKYVAAMLPEDKIDGLMCFMPVWNIGCGLGQKPVITSGNICSFGHDIDNKDFMMVSASIYFGNSGGATFLQETGQFIGVPSRVSAKQIGWSVDIVPHMGLSITLARVYGFLREHVFDFIFDPSRTSVECEEDRQQKREQDLLRRIDADPELVSENINPKGQKVPYYK